MAVYRSRRVSTLYLILNHNITVYVDFSPNGGWSDEQQKGKLMTIRTGWVRDAVAVSLAMILSTGVALSEVKLDYRQRQAVERQERNMVEIEKKITAGNITMNGSTQWLSNKLDAMVQDLSLSKVPEGNSKVADLMARIARARETAGGATAPTAAVEPAAATQQTAKPGSAKLAPGARAAVDRQWGRLQQQKANLLALNEDVEKATSLKKWDDRSISFKLQGVLEDLDKNGVPQDHAYYIKIRDMRTNLLTSLDNVKAKAEPKIAAYANAVNLDNYPEVQQDIERADLLAHLYQNVGVSHLENPARAKELLGQAGQVTQFIADSRIKYAPLIENKLGPGNSLETKLSWLERNFEKFKLIQETFIKGIPDKVDKLLASAESMSTKARDSKNPQIFTGGVRQALDQSTDLLASFSLAKGKDDSTVKALNAKLQASEEQAAVTAKALEGEILAANRAPRNSFTGTGGSGFIGQMRKEWENRNPGDRILDVRIVAADWEHAVGYDWNNAYSRWDKYDRQWLKMAVIVQSDEQIATVYPAFINRDNMSGRESLVASHKSTYEIRKMLVKNLD